MAEAIDELTEHLEFLISSLIISRSDVVPQAREVVRILGRTPHAVRIAVRILATKIKSSKEQEALHALELVDLWMKECGPHFQAEVGKFQFLNELIKLLHPQYSFARTPPVVRQRVLIFLYKWTKDYSHETRILQAYELLKKLGFASKEDPVFSRQRREVATAATSRKRSIFEDETKSWLLQSLLQSKNPEDHQTANRLIKFMVKEDERREELNARRRIEIDSVRNNAKLLCEMLDSYHPGRASAEELKIIKNVHRFCEHIHPLVIRFASEVQNNDKMLGEVLNANDLLAEALNKYALVMEQGVLVNSPSKSDSLLDLSTPSEEKLSSAPATGLPDQLQGLDLGRTRSSLAGTAQQSSLEVLGDIFGSLAENESSAAAASVAASSDHDEPTILQPVSLLLSTGEMGAGAIEPEKEQKPKGLTELDRLGEIILKDNLPPSHTHQSSFSRPTLKIPMNLLGKSQSASSGESSSEASAPMNLRDLEEQVQRIEIDPGKIHKRPQTSNKSEKISDGDSKEDISERSVEPPFAISESLSASASSEHQSTVLDSEQNALCSGGSDHYSKRALADVFVSLDSIKAGSIPPLSLWDKNGLSVVLHFAKDAPRPDVSVIVVTTVNGSTKPITRFLFQAAVPKTCKLRLLPPSGTDLPAQRHFLLPPSVITQVMLIANPKKDPVSLKYMISYTLDGEMTTEVGEVETLPMGSLIISRSDAVPQAKEVVHILGRTPHAVRIGLRILATKIQSPKEQEALHALELVDLWMRECGPHFQAEVGKFQFLNELIKLLHPQYSFARTPPVVRQRVLIFLYKWTKDYSHETRILQAYELLKKLGFASKEDPVFSRQRREVATAATSRKRSIFEDETKSWLLQSLLQSKNPEDHQTANRLIKFMVKEDERREELNARRRIEIDSVRNNAKLLCEMLDSYHPGRTSAEELKMIKNVHRFCEHIHPLVIRFSSEVQNNDKMLGEVLNANDFLADALNKYALVMEQGVVVNSPSKSDSLLDLSTPSEEKLSSAPATRLPDQLQDLDLGRTRSSLADTAQQSSLEVLGDIFGSLAENESSAAAASVAASSDHAEPTILQPVSLLLSTGEMGAAAIEPEKEQKPKGLTELDLLGEIMLKDNLPPSHTHQSSFSRPTLKIPMNLLGKSQSASSGESSSEASAPMNLRDLEEQVQRIEIDPGKIHKRPQSSNTSEKISDGDSKEDISERSVEPPFAISESLSASASSEHQSTVLDSEQNALCSGGSDHYSKRVEIKSLADVFVSLDSIKPGSIPPLSLWDKNGLSVELHFAKDAPRPDVSVIVVTTVNGNTKPITSFLFQAAVPKTCKLRLLPPSGTDLPAQRHFLLPPSVITQVMLIANPKKDPVSLKYMISYTLDGEMTTEVGEVETLPMVRPLPTANPMLSVCLVGNIMYFVQEYQSEYVE